MTSAAVCAFLIFSVALEARASSSASALHDRAKNLYDVGNYRAALSLYERILAENPGDGLAWDLSAWCLRYLGDRESAEKNYKKSLTLLSGDESVWPLIGLGELYLDGGLYDEALVRLREALGIASDNAEAAGRAYSGIRLARDMSAGGRPGQTAPPLEDTDERQARELLGETSMQPGGGPAAVSSVDADATGGKPRGKPGAEKTPPPGVKPADAKKNRKPPEDSASAGRRPAEKPDGATVYGIKLGSPLEEAEAAVSRQGLKLSGEPFKKSGKTYHEVEGMRAPVPASIEEGVANRRFYVVSVGGTVLSVNAELDYGKNHSFDGLRDSVREAIPSLAGADRVSGMRETENIFSHEINAAVSGVYGLWAIVTDKGGGACRVEIQHIDLHVLSDYWSGAKK